jgi:hypothetical protein
MPVKRRGEVVATRPNKRLKVSTIAAAIDEAIGQHTSSQIIPPLTKIIGEYYTPPPYYFQTQDGWREGPRLFIWDTHQNTSEGEFCIRYDGGVHLTIYLLYFTDERKWKFDEIAKRDTNEEADELCLKCYEKMHGAGPLRYNGKYSGGYARRTRVGKRFRDDELNDVMDIPRGYRRWLIVAYKGNILKTYSLSIDSVW